ncbi:MAG: nickel-responsive transcriptional regulator NikR [Acidobacteriota bacterium]
MKDTIRFGISMSTYLLHDFDRLISKRGYKSRSEAIRDIIRERLVDQEWFDPHKETIGTITLVYSHEVRELAAVLTSLEHDYYKNILSSMHIHLDPHNCLEVLIVRGKSGIIKKIADRLTSTKGVRHGKLTMSTIGKKLT